METFIPGEFIALATFPGIIVHEMAHWLACRITRTPVVKLCLFQMVPDQPHGYVLHITPNHPAKQLLIGVAPFFINTMLAIVLSRWVGNGFLLDLPWYGLVGEWLALSVGMHAFPSEVDVSHTWHATQSKSMPRVLKFLAYPIVGFMYLASRLAPGFFDLLYAAIIVWGIAPIL